VQRSMLRLIGASLAGLATLGVAPLHAQQGKIEEAIMAVPVVSLAFSMTYIADDLNLWEKHGIKIKTMEISGIGAMNSVIAGSTQFTQSSGSAITRAAARGQRLLAVVGTLERPSVQVVLRKEFAAGFDPKASLEKRVQALRGRTIAVDSVNSIIHAYVRFIARRGGFDPEEIRIAVMQPPNMVVSLKTKAIDGFAMAPPWTHQPVLDGDAVMIASGPDGDPADLIPFVNTAVATKPETCERRRALCIGVGRTFRDAVNVVLDRPADALALLKKRFPQLDERQLALAFEDIRKITPRSLAVTQVGLENAELLSIEAGLLKPEEKLKSYDGLFTDQFVR
jgi:NitT/TauT family transport system substrate-binding protein